MGIITRKYISGGEAQIDVSSSNVHTIPTGTSTIYTLPTAGGVYAITAQGDSAYIKGGTGSFAATTSDYRDYIAEGTTWGPYKLPDAVTGVAVIGVGGSGKLIFQEIKVW